MKRFFLAFAAVLMALSVSAAELNVYASGLKAGEVKDGKVEISYLLNATATTLELQLIGADDAVVKTIPLTGDALAKGAHTVTVDLSSGPYGTFAWAIKAAGEERTEISADLLADDTNYDFYQPRGVAADINPESPFFGQIYMGSSKSGLPSADSGVEGAVATPTGVAIFDALLAQQGSIYDGGITWEADGWGPGRVKVGEDGMVYINDHAKSTSGIFKMDPANPTANFIPVLDTAQRGVTFALPVAMEIIGSGAERTLYTWNYIGVNDGQILKYAIGENDNSTVAPDTFAVASFTGNQYAEIAIDGRGGFWLSQNRGQIDGYHALAHMNNEGVIDYKAGDHTDIFTSTSGKYSTRGVVSLNKEKNILAMAWDKTVTVFSIVYDETTGAPAITELYRTGTIGTNVDGICFDYANNLYVGSASSERLHVYATPSANVQVTPAPAASTITLVDPKPAGEQLNVYAYGLSSTLEGGNLTVKYSLNAFAREVSLLIYDAEGQEVAAHKLGYKQAGAHEATIDLDATELVDGKYTWAIKAQGDARTEVSTNVIAVGDYDFYRPQGFAVNTNPESPFFGQTYITNAAATSNTDKYEGAAQGIYVYDPLYALQGSYVGGITWGAVSPHRLFIDENDLVYASNWGNDGGIYIMDPANPTANFKSLFDPAKRGETYSQITGFDIIGTGADRVLVACDGVNYDTNLGQLGAVVKWTIGETNENFAGAADTIGKSTALGLCNNNNTILDDGRGGYWIYQNRGAEGDWQCLVNIKADGTVNYDSSTDKLGIVGSNEGAMVLNADKTMMAIGVNGGIIYIYDITWGEDGKPVLTKKAWETKALGNKVNGIAWDYANNLITGSRNTERLGVYALPSENVTTVPAAAKYAIDYVGPGLSGKFTVGGEGADYATLAEATAAVNAKPIEGDVTLLIAADLEEATNSGIVNATDFTVTIRPATAEMRTITFTQADDNAGASGSIIIGMANAVAGTGETASKNIVIDGAAEDSDVRNLTIIHNNKGGRIVTYGAVSDIAIKNVVLKNEAVSISGDNSGCAIQLRGTDAGKPADITISGCDIKAANHTWVVIFTNGKSLLFENNIMDMAGTMANDYSYGLHGATVEDTVIVRGNQFINVTSSDASGVLALSPQGGTWIIENNYFSGMDFTGAEGVATRINYIRPIAGPEVIIRHNTFYIPSFTVKPANANNDVAALEITSGATPVIENNIFVSAEETAQHAFFNLTSPTAVNNNVFYMNPNNTKAFVVDALTPADYVAANTTNKVVEVHFTDAAKGDLSLATESDGDKNLAVPAIAEVATDITGKARHAELVYAGAFEGGDFKDTPSAIENTEVENDNVRKVFENGNVYIIRDGVKYNLMGTVVK